MPVIVSFFLQREMLVASFHFPLHRYLAAFTCQAVKCMGMSLKNILPSANLLTLLMIHPLRVQVSRNNLHLHNLVGISAS